MARFSFKRAAQEVREQARTPKRFIVIVIAIILLIFGVIGTFIPIVPARLISIPPLLLLSIYSPTVYAWVKRKSQKYPRIQSWFDRVRNWIIHKLH